MKKLLTFAVMLSTVLAISQELHILKDPQVLPVTFHGESMPLIDWDHSQKFENPRVKPEKLGYVPKNDWPLNTFQQDKLHTGYDPAFQTEGPIHLPSLAKAIDQNFDGMGYSGVNPSDNILDVGPNHVIQMMNGSSGAYFQIYDKAGNILVAQTYLDNFFSANGGDTYSGLGDPIVLYDAMADRWFMAEFISGGNDIKMAVSTTPDPTGSWYFYSFTAPNFPDYLKFGVWTDMYIMTSNESGPNAIYALDRAAMLSGTNPTVQRFTVPTYGSIGFQATTPVTHDGGDAPPAGALGMFMRMADDAWTGGPAQDQLELWTMDIDFTNSANSIVSGPQTMPVDPFDTELCGFTSFSCIDQPSSNTNLDPLREVLMNRLQYRNMGTHEAIVASHATDVSGADQSGVRWYEVRRNGGASNNWNVYQQGTFAPDGDSRWMSGIAMNAAGDIGLMYNVSSGSTFPGIRYTGRYANDPLGQMTIAETSIIEGSAANGSNRYGDYNSLDSDPVTGSFWLSGNYNPSSQWATRIAEFSFPPLNCTAPTLTQTITDDCANLEFNLTVDIGADGDASSYTVSYILNGGSSVPVSTVANGLVNIGDFSFGDIVDVTVTHDQEPACNQTIPGLSSAGSSCCVAPTLNVTTTADCTNGLFNVSLDIGTDGDAPDYTVSYDDGSGSITLGTFAAANVNVGDFALGTILSLNVQHNGFPNSCDQTINEVTVSSICNDDCAGAETISCGTVISGSTIGASSESPDPGTCGTGAGTGGGVWYTFVGQNSNNPGAAIGSTGDDILLTFCSDGGSASYDSKLRVFSGTCGGLTCVAGNDDSCGLSSEVAFTSEVGTTYYVLVHGYDTAEGAFDLAFVCTPPPACFEPDGLTVSSIGETTADLSWNELGTASLWDLEIGPVGFTATGTPTVSGHNSTTYTWSDGIAGFAYDFYVRADCGADGPSLWVGPVSWIQLNTPPPAPQGINCTPGTNGITVFVEGFENGANGWTGDLNSGNGSWEIPNDSGSANTGADSAQEGSVYVNYEASGSTTNAAELISPAIDLTDALDDAELSFYMHAYGSEMGNMSVSVGNTATGPWTSEFAWNGELQTSGADAWVPVGVDLSAYVGQSIHIRFTHTGTGGFEGDMCLDLIQLDACFDVNSCFAPNNLTANVLGPTSVELSWTDQGASDDFDIEIVDAGTAPSGVATVTSVSNPYTWTAAISNTSYDYYVRANCGSDQSGWIGPLQFETLIDYCGGDIFVDEGGVAADYSNSQNEVYVICPDAAGQHVEVTFTLFDVEARSDSTLCWDQLYIYDGSTTSSPLISPSSLGLGPNSASGFCFNGSSGEGTGDLNGVTVISSDVTGCLTFNFISDGSVTDPGWEATVACVNSCPQDIAQNGVIDIDDFLALNSAFGNACNSCPEDLTNDGIVNVDDFLELNSVYGQNCSDLFAPVGDLLSVQEDVVDSRLYQDVMNNRGSVNRDLLAYIEKMIREPVFTINPNPNAGDRMWIDVKGLNDINDARITVYDISGNKVRIQRVSDATNAPTRIELSFESTLASGVYVVELESVGLVSRERFVVE